MKNLDLYNDNLRRYLNGEMTGPELQQFETEIANDEFLSDAIDGYKATAANPSDVNLIKQKLFPQKKKINLVKALIYSGIAASLAFVAIYTVIDINKNSFNSGLQASQTIHKSFITTDSIVIIDTIRNDVQIFIPEKNALTAELRPLPQKVVVPESIAPLHLNKTIKPLTNNIDYNIGDYYRFKSNHLYTYIGNFKVVDYRYEKRIKSGIPEVPSHFQSFEFDNGLPVSAEEVSYTAFLEEALSKTDALKYQDAIDDFNLILEQYPNDINAVFYKAFCLYELNNNQNAIKYFDIALSGKINTFHEESLWYKGLIYKEEKQYAAAERVLEEIVNDNGYYGVQAKKELDELYKLYLNE